MPSIQPHTEKFKGGDLASLLALAESSEEIKLTGDRKAARLCITNALGIHRWAQLRIVHLKGLEASASELEDFLRRHALSLQRLTLDEFNLTSGSWKNCGAMVAVIALALELILGFVLTQSRPTKIEQYLPLPKEYLDVSGPNKAWYDKAKRADDTES